MLTRFAFLTLCVTACTTVDSDNVLTSGLSVQMTATADGRGSVFIRTTFYVENPGKLTYLELEGDDQVMAYGPNGARKQLRESQLLGTTTYLAEFEEEDGGSEYVVELSRSIDEGAPDSRITLPQAFSITNIEHGDEPGSEGAIVAEWSPANQGDDMDYQLKGDCIQTKSGSIEGDPGSLTLAKRDLVFLDETTLGPTCKLSLVLTRSRSGVVDPNYGHGGDAVGQQTRTAEFSLSL